MCRLFASICLLTGLTLHAAEELPLHPEDLAILEAIVAERGLETEVTQRAMRDLGDAVHWAAKGKGGTLRAIYNEEGRVVMLRGNGPWLSNRSLELASRLPALREIYSDHNTPPRGSDLDPADFNGSGFLAFREKPLEKVMIGHALTDEGVRALAMLPQLKSLQVEHARGVTGDGIRALREHHSLEFLGWGSSGRYDEAAFFETAASLPNGREFMLKEAVITYDGGLHFLKEANGAVEIVRFTKSIVLPVDVERLLADHPGIEVEWISDGELLDWGRKLQRRATPELAEWVEEQAARIEANGVGENSGSR